MITDQVKDLCYGLYGKTAIPVNPQVQKKALSGYSRGEEPISCRPAEVLEPELEKAKEDVSGLAADLDDTLIYALYPVTGKRFLKWKYGKDEVPDEVRSKTLEEVTAEQELIQKAKAGQLVEKKGKEAPPKSENIRTFNVFVEDEHFEIGVDEVGGLPRAYDIRPMPAQEQVISPITAPAPAPPVVRAPSQPVPPKPEAPEPVLAHAATKSGDGTPMIAPMPGMIVRYEKKVGDTVTEGETVVILEAMKMENALPAPANGTIKEINFGVGDSVSKNDVLCIIA
jgi:biotin carboxyl carrier protein